VRPASGEWAKRWPAQREAEQGEKSSRVQDLQAKDTSGAREEEGGERPIPAPPEDEPAERVGYARRRLVVPGMG
jgi:hypothetical protein